MKKYNILLFFLLLLVLASDTVPVAGQTNGGRWKLVFSDEFNLPDGSQPDSAKWSRSRRAPSIWARWNSDSPGTVFIKDGHLVCRAIPNREAPGDTAAMLTGAINTKDKFAFQYGKVEVRVKTNLLEGNFPAAWMRPQSDGTPYRYGEFDIFEAFGADGIARQTIHSHRSAILKKQKISTFSKKVSVGKWHVYGLEWTPEYILLTIDGRATSYYGKSTELLQLEEGQWGFDRPFFLILNQSVGTKNWNTPNTNRVYETRFDWIRVYQRQ
jgi:beta-glucanase (GH16 family)